MKMAAPRLQSPRILEIDFWQQPTTCYHLDLCGQKLGSRFASCLFCAFEFFFVRLAEKRIEVSEYFQHYLDRLFGWFENSPNKSRILDFKTFQTVSKNVLMKLRLRSTSQVSQQAQSDSMTDWQDRDLASSFTWSEMRSSLSSNVGTREMG